MEPSESIPVGKQLARILACYETEMDMTLPDVVVLFSALAEESGNQALVDAVKLYREEEGFERTNLGMRGDMDEIRQYHCN